MKIKTYIHSIRKAAAFLSAKSPFHSPEIGVIMGSGLGSAVPKLDKAVRIPYHQIPGLPKTTVRGHSGHLILGKMYGRQVAIMQGRFHYYEGHSMESIALPIRVMEYLGLKTLVVTAAVGSMRRDMAPGDLVVLKDHINAMGRNPLRAFHEQEFGTMFPDLLNAYDPALRRLALSACREEKARAKEGVYYAVSGPSYETPAEIRAFRQLGGDVVGMSVVPEVIVARQMGLRVLAITWVANLASGMTNRSLSHEEVLALGQQLCPKLRGVLERVLKRLK